MPRFSIPQPASVGDTVEIRGSDAHHIKNVLRASAGDRIELFDDRGTIYDARVAAVASGIVRIKITAARTSDENESPVALTLALAYLKDKKMDALVRQLTELGASRWIPFFSERSVPKPTADRIAKRHERWCKISREAVKQCRRRRSMVVEAPLSYDAMLDCSRGDDLRVIFWEKHPRGLDLARNRGGNRTVRRIFLILGPEGGFSEPEIRKAIDSGCVTAGLGPRILRAETAAVAAAAVLQYLYGDLGRRV